MKIRRYLAAKFGGVTRIMIDAALIVALITGAAYAFSSGQPDSDRPVSMAGKH